MVFASRLTSDPRTLATAESDRVRSDRQSVFIDISNIEISGKPATIFDYIATPEESGPVTHNTVVMIPLEKELIEIRTWTQDERMHDFRREDMLSIIEQTVIK